MAGAVASVAVSYAAPVNDGGTAILEYGLACTSSTGGVSGTGSALPPALTGSVSGLTDGKTYTCTVRARNAVGWGAWSSVSASIMAGYVPGAPTLASVTRGNGSIAVAYSAPLSVGSAAVVQYGVACTSSNGGAAGSVSVNAPTLSGTVTALTNGKSYTCQARARNAVGWGAWSAASGVVVPATFPGAAAAPTATSGNGTAGVSYAAPVNTGGAMVVEYGLSCTSTDGGTTGSGSVSAPTLSGTVSGLTNGKHYTCRVRARNVVGWGAWSAASPALIVGAPVAPSISLVTTALAYGSIDAPVGQLRVTFSAPADGANGSAYTGFMATCTEVGTGAVLNGLAGPAATTVTVSAAKLGSAYVCGVAAINARGMGVSAQPPVSPAAVAPATDGRVVAGAPARVTVTSVSIAGAGGLTVGFSPPASDNGSAVTSFTVRCVSTNGGVAGAFTASDYFSTYTVQNLTAGKTYRCFAAATNSRGRGIWSAPSATIILG